MTPESPFTAYRKGFDAGQQFARDTRATRPPAVPYPSESDSAVEWLLGFSDGRFAS